MTFTRKAAGEMRERIIHALAEGARADRPAAKSRHEARTRELARAALEQDRALRLAPCEASGAARRTDDRRVLRRHRAPGAAGHAAWGPTPASSTTRNPCTKRRCARRWRRPARTILPGVCCCAISTTTRGAPWRFCRRCSRGARRSCASSCARTATRCARRSRRCSPTRFAGSSAQSPRPFRRNSRQRCRRWSSTRRGTRLARRASLRWPRRSSPAPGRAAFRPQRWRAARRGARSLRGCWSRTSRAFG